MNSCQVLKPQFNKDFIAIDDKEVFVNTKAQENYIAKIEAYNKCVETCQKDLR